VVLEDDLVVGEVVWIEFDDDLVFGEDLDVVLPYFSGDVG